MADVVLSSRLMFFKLMAKRRVVLQCSNPKCFPLSNSPNKQPHFFKIFVVCFCFQHFSAISFRDLQHLKKKSNEQPPNLPLAPLEAPFFEASKLRLAWRPGRRKASVSPRTSSACGNGCNGSQAKRRRTRSCEECGWECSWE